MDGRYKKWQTKDRWLSCNKTQHIKLGEDLYRETELWFMPEKWVKRNWKRKERMLQSYIETWLPQSGITCPNFVVWEAKHFFCCWLFRIRAVNHMCTSLVNNVAVAYISLTCVLLPVQVPSTQNYAPDLLISLALSSSFISSKLPEPFLLRQSPSLFLSAVDVVSCSFVQDDLEPTLSTPGSYVEWLSGLITWEADNKP